MRNFGELQAGVLFHETELAGWRLFRRRSGGSTRRGSLAAPLEWLAGTVRDWALRFGVNGRFSKLENRRAAELRRAQEERERLSREYSEGYMAGWRECFETCLQAVEDEIASADDLWRMGAALTGSTNSRRNN